MRLSLVGLLCLAAMFASTACSPNQNPDQIREKTAQETAALKRDSKAVAEGIKDGLTEKKLIDLNTASKDELEQLPGINSRAADHIIAERPYANVHQLLTRRVLSEDEYSQIRDHISVTH